MNSRTLRGLVTPQNMQELETNKTVKHYVSKCHCCMCSKEIGLSSSTQEKLHFCESTFL